MHDLRRPKVAKHASNESGMEQKVLNISSGCAITHSMNHRYMPLKIITNFKYEKM